MTTVGWIILIVVGVPALGVLVWIVLDASLVRVAPGTLGFLLVKGRPTDTALPPGPHLVPAVRRRMIQAYPSVELAFRAGSGIDPEVSATERSAPPLPVTLGDRTNVVVSFTVRFRLDVTRLRHVHERFGPSGIFPLVRDRSSMVMISGLGAADVGVEDTLNPALEQCQQRLEASLRERLAADGIDLVGLVVTGIDLGRTGEVIQATLRSRYELEREQAEAATRLARAVNDADLQQHTGSVDGSAWRYREPDLWRDLVQQSEALHVALRPGGPTTGVLAQGTATAPPVPPRADEAP